MEDNDHRNLDLAPTASIDVVSLNNKLIQMRVCVKMAKVHTINKLTRNIKLLKAKRGTEEQKEKNASKAERMIDEVEIIRKLHPDKISKFSIGNRTSYADMCLKNSDVSARAMARLCQNQRLEKTVTEFRNKHPDWESLAAFLLTKDSGRRFKKKKETKKDTALANVQASRTFIQSYLETKVSTDKSDYKAAMGSLHEKRLNRKAKKDTANNAGSSTVSKQQEVHVKESDSKSQSYLDVNESDITSSESDFETAENIVRDEDSCSDSDESDSDLQSNLPDNSCEKIKGKTTQNIMKATKTSSVPKKEKSDKNKLQVNSTENKSESIKKSTTLRVSNSEKKKLLASTTEDKTPNKNRGEIVVCQINLDDLPEGDSMIRPENTIDIFSDVTSSMKKVNKNSFFMGGESDSGDASEELEEKETFGGHHDDEGHRSRNKFETKFVGSLSSKSNSGVVRNKDSVRNTRNDSVKGNKSKDPSFTKYDKKRSKSYSPEKHKKMKFQSTKGGETPNEYDGRAHQQKTDDARNKNRPGASVGTSGNIHPSWEASKRKKEMEKNIPQYQGKKIKFDD